MPDKEYEITNAKELVKVFRSLVNNSDYRSALLYVIPLMYKELCTRGVLSQDKRTNQYVTEAHGTDKYANHSILEKYFKTLEVEEFPDILNCILNERENVSSSSISNDMSPVEISTLVYKLLDIKDGDKFYDLGSGYGVVLANLYGLASKEGKSLYYVGKDTDRTACALGSMILAVYGLGEMNFALIEGDATKEKLIDYSKAYTFPPTRERSFYRESKYRCELYPGLDMWGPIYEQWIYIDALLSGLTRDNAKAVALVYGRTLLGVDKNKYVQRLLNDGWIEGIIELPSSTFASMNRSFLVVFSKGNTKVKSLNCNSNEFITSGMRDGHKYRDIDSEAIYREYTNENSPYLQHIKNSDLKDKMSWHPSSLSYSVISQDDINYVPLSKACTVSSGLVSTLRDFTLSEEETGYKILTSSEINETGINWSELHNVTLSKEVSEKYLLHKGDIVITSKSTKVKVAVIDEEPIGKLILTGGMIKVVTDSNRLNPYYLKMYLDSEEGSKALSSISVGTAIMHISPSLLSSLKVPVINIAAQNNKANRYEELVNEITDHQKEIKKIENQISTLINKKD